jgi:hypothetical protein
MTGYDHSHALAQRYDGPLPGLAALPPDADAPWPVRVANRKRWAAADIRLIGGQVLAARRAFAASGDMADHRAWVPRRAALGRALRAWAAWRDMVADETPCRC